VLLRRTGVPIVLQRTARKAPFPPNQSKLILLSLKSHLIIHHPKKWTGRIFDQVTLADLGVNIRLGHAGCLAPKVGPSGFIVIHVNGLHPVNLLYCGCSLADSLHEQLLHRGLFPATTTQPKTCATFQLLRHYHIQSLQSKISTIHFFQALDRETDNTGTSPKKVRTRKLCTPCPLN